MRGKESARLLVGGQGGRVVPLYILGLGTSVGTPPGGITAPALVVRSFDELQAVKDKVSYQLGIQARGQ